MEKTEEGQTQAELETGRWVIDPVHSTASFAVIDSTDLKIIAGRFTDLAGEVVVDESGRTTISGALKVTSIDTGDEDRDDDLRSADYLDAAAHPEFRLEPSTVEVHQNGAVTIDGSFALGGSPTQIQLKGDLIGVGRDGKGNLRVALITTGALHWGAFDVRVLLAASAIREE